ncbi:MAG: C39 family peptidase [Deltaproteobacteria bacterium]|nr:C39 family peptidase [Deltaproteobacteria bacterium]
MRRSEGHPEKAFRQAFHPRALCMAVLVFSLFIVLFGCVARPGGTTSDLAASIDSGKVKNVPFYAQLDFQCGPASLAEVLTFYGEDVTPDEVADAIFRKSIRGTVTIDMVLYARRKGFAARWYSGSADDIRRSVDRGVPLIVMVDLGFANISNNHYMVVVGYNPDGVIVNSAKAREKLITWNYFLSRWDRTDRWTLRIYSKTQPKTEHTPR